MIDENDTAIEHSDGFNFWYTGSSELPEEKKAHRIKKMFDLDFTVLKIKVPGADLPKLTDENISGYEHVLNNQEVDPNHPNSG